MHHLLRMRAQSQKEHFNRPPDNPQHGSPSESSGSPHSSTFAHKVNSDDPSSDSNSSNSNKSQQVSELFKTNQFHSCDSSEIGLHYLNQKSSQSPSGKRVEDYFCHRQTPYWKKPHSSNYKHPYWRNFALRSSKSDDEFEGNKSEEDIIISDNPEVQIERDKQSKTTCGRKYSSVKPVDHLNPKLSNRNKSKTAKRKRSLWVAFQKRVRRTFETKYPFYLDPSHENEMPLGDLEISENKSSNSANKQVQIRPVEMEKIIYDQCYLYPSYKKVHKCMPRSMLKRIVEGKNKMMSFSNSERNEGEVIKSGDSNPNKKQQGPSMFDKQTLKKSLAIKHGDLLPSYISSLNMSDGNNTNLLKTDCQDTMLTEDIRCDTSGNPLSKKKFKHLKTKVDKTEELGWNKKSNSKKPSSKSNNENSNCNNKNTKLRDSCLKCKEVELKNYLIGRWREVLGCAEPNSVKSHDTRESSLDMDTSENVSKSSNIEIKHIGVSKLNSEKHMPMKYPNSIYSSETKNNDCAHHLPFNSRASSKSNSKEPEKVDSRYFKKNSTYKKERDDLEQTIQDNTAVQPKWFLQSKPLQAKRVKKFYKSLNNSVKKPWPPSIGKNCKLQESSMNPSRTNINRFNAENKKYLCSRNLKYSKLMNMKSCYVKVYRIDNTLLKQHGILYEPKIEQNSCVADQNSNIFPAKSKNSIDKETQKNLFVENISSVRPTPTIRRVKSSKDRKLKKLKRKQCSKLTKNLQIWEEPTQPQTNDSTKPQISNNDSDRSTPSIIVSIPKQKIKELLPQLSIREPLKEPIDCVVYKNAKQFPAMTTNLISKEYLKDSYEENFLPIFPLQKTKRVKSTEDVQSKEVKRKRFVEHTSNLKISKIPTKPQNSFHLHNSTKRQILHTDIPQRLVEDERSKLLDDDYSTPSIIVSIPIQNIEELLPQQLTNEPFSEPIRCVVDQNSKQLPAQSQTPNESKANEFTQTTIFNDDISQTLIQPPEFKRTDSINVDHLTSPIIESPGQNIEELFPRKSIKKPFSEPKNCAVLKNTEQFPAQSTQPIAKDDMREKSPSMLTLSKTAKVKYSKDKTFKKFKRKRFVTRANKWEIADVPIKSQTTESTQPPISSLGIAQELIELLQLETTKLNNDGCLKTPMIGMKIREKPAQPQTTESTQPTISNSDNAQKLIEPIQFETTKLNNDDCLKTPVIVTNISEKPTQPQTTESTQPTIPNSDIAPKLIEPIQRERLEPINDRCFKILMIGSLKRKVNESKHKYVCKTLGPLKFKFMSSKTNKTSITPSEPTRHPRELKELSSEHSEEGKELSFSDAIGHFEEGKELSFSDVIGHSEEGKELPSSDATGHSKEGKELSFSDAAGHFEEGKELSFSDVTGHSEEGKELPSSDATGHSEEGKELPSSDAAGHSEEGKELPSSDATGHSKEGKELSFSDATGYNEEGNELPFYDSTRHSEEREELSCGSENNCNVADDISCGFAACSHPISYTPVRPPEEGYAEPYRNRSPFYSYCYTPINVIPMGDTYE